MTRKFAVTLFCDVLHADWAAAAPDNEARCSTSRRGAGGRGRHPKSRRPCPRPDTVPVTHPTRPLSHPTRPLLTPDTALVTPDTALVTPRHSPCHTDAALSHPDMAPVTPDTRPADVVTSPTRAGRYVLRLGCPEY